MANTTASQALIQKQLQSKFDFSAVMDNLGSVKRQFTKIENMRHTQQAA